MRSFVCKCGNSLYFDSTQCVKCRTESGLCPNCRTVSPMFRQKPDGLKCGHKTCGAMVHRCANFAEIGCNRMVICGDGPHGLICDYCALTAIIPDLSVEGNRDKWKVLERAKRRVLYILDLLGLPFRADVGHQIPSVSFEFKADADVPVHTGHENGVITINLREADDVEREIARVSFNEPQRTLVGHFRHELGHYFWDRLVQGHREQECREIFGDDRNPSYSDAMTTYYETGPLPTWRENFISAYATMHPWEDFAETFGAYLDMVTILDTGHHYGLVECDFRDVDSMVATYQQLGIVANELNRDMGLVDLVPEVFVAPIIQKMKFLHTLASAAHGEWGATAGVLELV